MSMNPNDYLRLPSLPLAEFNNYYGDAFQKIASRENLTTEMVQALLISQQNCSKNLDRLTKSHNTLDSNFSMQKSTNSTFREKTEGSLKTTADNIKTLQDKIKFLEENLKKKDLLINEQEEKQAQQARQLNDLLDRMDKLERRESINILRIAEKEERVEELTGLAKCLVDEISNKEFVIEKQKKQIKELNQALTAIAMIV